MGILMFVTVEQKGGIFDIAFCMSRGDGKLFEVREVLALSTQTIY